MKNIFTEGDIKIFTRKIEEADTAAFNGDMVHPVCATFALARDIEWASRLFVLDMKEDDEEGIGTVLTIHHKSPALAGQEIQIEVKVLSLVYNELICSYTVKSGERLIAEGKTGQKILKKNKIQQIFISLQSHGKR